VTTLETPDQRVCSGGNNCKNWSGVNEDEAGDTDTSLTFPEKKPKLILQSKPL